jgi:hypothetical protein
VKGMVIKMAVDDLKNVADKEIVLEADVVSFF